MVAVEPDEPGAQIVTLPPSRDRGHEPDGSRHPAMRRAQAEQERPDVERAPVEAQPEPSPHGQGSEGSRSRRASVPSWDEILFGGPNGDQG